MLQKIFPTFEVFWWVDFKNMYEIISYSTMAFWATSQMGQPLASIFCPEKALYFVHLFHQVDMKTSDSRLHKCRPFVIFFSKPYGLIKRSMFIKFIINWKKNIFQGFSLQRSQVLTNFSMPYIYSRPHVYSICQIFQALIRLFPVLRLFGSLE
jgi:hypothetical protein